MSLFTPTQTQQSVIDEESNCVVNANPGSGKTGTIAHKIRKILPKLPKFKGVIAISYTNQASLELEHRCLLNGADGHGSYFGTIHSFLLNEIIIPFGEHIFGKFKNELVILEADEIENNSVFNELEAGNLDASKEALLLSYVKALYIEGQVVLEAFGYLAIHIFRNSRACRNYLHARFSHVFIDEYQDCGYWQHQFFLELVELGMIGIAVGDINQSIFGFAGRDSRYLVDLLNHPKFVSYELYDNHRSHKSIIDYSLTLISRNYESFYRDHERNVYEKHIVGDETDIGTWIQESLDICCERFDIRDLREIAILCRNDYTQNRVLESLSIPAKQYITTPLDKNPSLWGNLFRRVLTWVFDENLTKHELVEKSLYHEMDNGSKAKIMELLNSLERIAEKDYFYLKNYIDEFIFLARMLLPRYENQKAIQQLKTVLNNDIFVQSYRPPNAGQIQLMNLHKAKGKEFDLVFHLNLYRFIIPSEDWRSGEYPSFQQDMNLHYVGVTRARKAVILCTSSIRHNANNDTKSAEKSMFLTYNNLQNLRIACPF